MYIDTIDLAQCPLAAGDQIGVFDGDLCVGAALYEGEFPLVLIAWEDDIATPDSIDGYTDGNPMTFIWYDVSENAEIEFQLPPETQAIEDDPVAPDHSGFGRGFWARRSFANGISIVNQLPTEFKLHPNFPNPFNSQTVISLDLPERSKIAVELFNIRGQSLGTVWETVENAGQRKVGINLGALPSGVYFYRVTANGQERGGKFADVGKMLLLK